jgi:3-hydroxyethyl bacteriochlorophyllide a dehydrogenase
METQAIVFKKIGTAELERIKLPEPRPSDVVVENIVSGVSVGTERWAYIGKRSEISFPNIPGYMGIGRITEVGEKASGWGYRKGMLINYFRGRLCPEHDKSWMGTHMAKAVVDVTPQKFDPLRLDVHNVEILPEGLSPRKAALAGLCGVAMRGIEMAQIPAGVKVLVTGMGVIGQYAAQVCSLKGARVCVADIDSFRLDIAGKTGAAEWIVNSSKEKLEEKSQDIAPDGFDIIIDTSSKDTIVNTLFPLLKLRGKMVFQGWYPPPSSLDLSLASGYLPTFYFPCAHSGEAVANAMRLAAAGYLKSEELITHSFSPHDAKKLYQMIAENKEQFLGIIIDWSKL